MKDNYLDYFDSPIGIIEIKASENYLLSLTFNTILYKKNIIKNDITKKTFSQLEEYFKGLRREFELPILLDGTDFQKKVWNSLMKIPYGKTCSYKDIAQNVGNINASRAVGNANNKNKIPIVIPCHRVIGKNNLLIGYAAGLNIKKWLLDFENSNS
jgi:O-6-methylguanine DNA methyltransferase